MTEFYAWPAFARSIVALFIATCLLTQTVTVILNVFYQKRIRERVFEKVLELSILAHMLVGSMLFGQTVQSAELSLIPDSGYVGLRMFTFSVILVILVIVVWKTRNPLKAVLAVAAGSTLPLIEPLAGRGFSYVFLAAMLFWFARSFRLSLFCYKGIKINISALSVKNAIEALRIGVMFCEEDGYIVLANTQMKQVMTAITGKSHRNGRHFYGLLTLGKTKPGCEISWFDEQSICHMPDGEAWKFNVLELQMGRKKYFQLTASNVTERWKLTAGLRPKNEELLRKQKDLSEMISNLHVLTREIETQKAKMRIHDVLGQRLTILLRSVRNEKALDYELLRAMSHSLIEELKAINRAPAPRDELDSLVQTFDFVGVRIIVEGDLPESSDMGQLIIDIIREAVTNAVRHGFASQVSVTISEIEDMYNLRITDNGHAPSAEIIEGGGISGMRKKAGEFGGTVTVTTYPRFTITVGLIKK